MCFVSSSLYNVFATKGVDLISVSLTRDGHVYMMKLGKYYKIGHTSSVPRRHREINLELPEKADVVHTIATDDPEGIEVYWHRRFASKNSNGEWFSLSVEDFRAFKRRKFM
jgi:Meiotically up-regulated gene 113